MPAARGVKRAASKSSTTAASTAPKNKKKRAVAVQLEIPAAPKKRGHVLSCGQGDVGQLGLGEDVMEATKFKHVKALGDKIVDVYAGGMHTIALDSSGKVWTFGCNDEGALGRNTARSEDEASCARVALPAPAVSVAAGDSHSAALLNTGDVYAWGAFRDSHGSMGLVVKEREGKACKEPVKVEIGETAVAIASGSDHLVILSASGAVYTMGCGEQGQLGRLSQRSASRDARQGFSALLVPSKVTLKTSVCRIWAGYHATFALDSNDKMIAWGLNNYGQLGITGEKRKTALYTPTECDAFSARGGAWRGVAVGQHHCVVLDASGHVLVLGRCEYGRLGLGDREGDAVNLEPVPKLQNKKVISIAAGTSNSFAVTDTGEILSWGMGSEGQLGTGNTNDASEPTPAVIPPTSRTPIHVSAGGQHTVLLVEDPSAQKEESPAPESETSEQKGDTQSAESDDEVPAKKKKNEQEGEISSTSSAQPEKVAEDAKPQKVNGDEKKETAMEVDETDNTEKQKDETEKEPETKTADEQTDMDQTEPAKQETQPEVSKPETTDSSSQETTDSDAKSTEEPQKDVEMTEERPEMNGTPDAPVETKTVEALQTPLTTTA